VFILSYQIALLTNAYKNDVFVNKLLATSSALLKQSHIPDVGAKEELLKELQTDAFWQVVNVNRLDEVRLDLRDLIKYIKDDKQVQIFTHFEDTLDHGAVREVDINNATPYLQTYRERVGSFLRENKDHLVIQKLKANKPITAKDIQTLESILFDQENIGTKEEYGVY